jgi:hypothetical protein
MRALHSASRKIPAQAELGRGTLVRDLERASQGHPPDKQFSLLKANLQHPSLQFKNVGERHGQEIWSARITLSYRALVIKREDGYLWFWIGDHKAYDKLIS